MTDSELLDAAMEAISLCSRRMRPMQVSNEECCTVVAACLLPSEQAMFDAACDYMYLVFDRETKRRAACRDGECE